MATYKSPGTYIEEIPKFPSSVTAVDTACPAFILYTEKAIKDDIILTGEPTVINSIIDFESYFGKEYLLQPKDIKVQVDSNNNFALNDISFTGKVFYGYDAIRLFFDNGGGKCYIVSAGSYHDASFNNGLLNDSIALTNALAALEKIFGPTLIVIPDAILLKPDDCYALQKAAINQCGDLQDRFAILDLKENLIHHFNNAVAEFRNNIGTDNLKYAAAYAPWVYHSLPVNINPQILDGNIFLENNKAIDPTVFATIKNDLLIAVKKFLSRVPPSAAVAGVYCMIDSMRGVWKAPANVGVNSVIAPAEVITNQDQESLNIDSVNGKSINIIRSFPGKGVLIWGARTLDGNSSDWRYISVRRMMTMVEVSCKLAIETFVFEPNDANTWVTIKAMLDNLLSNLWRQGGLSGAKPEQAYFVQVGLGSTMTAQDILDGKLNVTVGLAVIRPAEFIVLRLELKMAQS